MTLVALRQKVEAGVAERLVPALFDRAKAVHAKREWRDCDCDWCTLKRRYSAQCAHAPYWMAYPEKRQWRVDESALARAALRSAFEAFPASVDTHAERGDSTEIEAPSLMGSAIAANSSETPNLSPHPKGQARSNKSRPVT